MSDSEMSNFFVEQGRTRVCGETYSTYVVAGKPRRTTLGGKRAISGCKPTRNLLKNRILVQGQGGAEFQPAGILQYVEELKRGSNTEIGPKDFFEMASRILTNDYGSDIHSEKN